MRPDECSWHIPPVGLAAHLKGSYTAFAVALCLAFEHSGQVETKGSARGAITASATGGTCPRRCRLRKLGAFRGIFLSNCRADRRAPTGFALQLRLKHIVSFGPRKVTAPICSFALNKQARRVRQRREQPACRRARLAAWHRHRAHTAGPAIRAALSSLTREGFVPYFALFSGHPGHTVSLSCFQRTVCPPVFQELDPKVTCLVELGWRNRTSFCLFYR